MCAAPFRHLLIYEFLALALLSQMIQVSDGCTPFFIIKHNMIKRTLFICTAITCLVMATQASTFRVNNVDPSAPYASIADAIEVASEGDTIMVEGSSTSYGDVTINKRVVLIGPGYWLRENGIETETGYSAMVKTLTTTEEGTVIMGMYSNRQIIVGAPGTIIQRCAIVSADYRSIEMLKGADNCVITQCFLSGGLGSNYESETTYRHFISNNIIEVMQLWFLNDSYVGYNTIYSSWKNYSCGIGNKIERNLLNMMEYPMSFNDQSYNLNLVDNLLLGNFFNTTINTDKDIRDYVYPQAANGRGAFAGDTPYVISGIPASPIIETLTVPNSAEAGGEMTIKVKLGTAK